ncbi:hypothetical protein TNIN_225781 [Trichonephila inaurata madagascariensis]|uniref:Uncharacterized protein n=1 Tax=Trichonephila inaurata madagascariensis TaxID=2747483 RepID=A0A8X6YCR1_9ARAC|nr:hypothetical protein TNIN_225781 [Trichonephila inaurata madagascariensis]
MQSIALITLQLLLVSGFVFSESSEESGESGESDYSDELDIDLRSTMCGLLSSFVQLIPNCLDYFKHEDSLNECYADLADLSGESMQQWYCSHTDDENQQADQCWQEKLGENNEKDFEEIVTFMVKCLVPEEGEENEAK